MNHVACPACAVHCRPTETRCPHCEARLRSLDGHIAETAAAAAEHGADAVGFVFVEKSPRFIAPEDAWPIIQTLPPFVMSVGLFQDASVDEYADAEQVCPTDFGQLHGTENEKTVRACGPRLLRAIQFNPKTIANDLRFWSGIEEVDAVLVDGSSGGEGTALDWGALAEARESCAKPLVLAGGLTPENVGEAIRTVRPYAVDVSSGVESERGVKDHEKIAAFCAAVRLPPTTSPKTTTSPPASDAALAVAEACPIR